jgi:hypothetical protein
MHSNNTREDFSQDCSRFFCEWKTWWQLFDWMTKIAPDTFGLCSLFTKVMKEITMTARAQSNEIQHHFEACVVRFSLLFEFITDRP